MPKPKTHPKLVIALCRALAAASEGRGYQWWVSVDPIRQALGVSVEAFREAVAYAVKHNLVLANAAPAHSISLAEGGRVLANKGR